MQETLSVYGVPTFRGTLEAPRPERHEAADNVRQSQRHRQQGGRGILIWYSRGGLWRGPGLIHRL